MALLLVGDIILYVVKCISAVNYQYKLKSSSDPHSPLFSPQKGSDYTVWLHMKHKDRTRYCAKVQVRIVGSGGWLFDLVCSVQSGSGGCWKAGGCWGGWLSGGKLLQSVAVTTSMLRFFHPVQGGWRVHRRDGQRHAQCWFLCRGVANLSV